ncbi:MAG: hypothetical protein WCF90_03195 [Methanomicrobiales archaeon]
MDLEDMLLEPIVVLLLKDAVYIREVRIINCQKRGNIGKTLNEKNIETIIRAEEPAFFLVTRSGRNRCDARMSGRDW